MPGTAATQALWLEDSLRPGRPAEAVSDPTDAASWIVLWGPAVDSATAIEICTEALATYRRIGCRFPTALTLPAAGLLWDERRGRLVACCDRLGLQPLYYRRARGGLEVAGSVEALLSGGRDRFSPQELNRRALACQLVGLAAPAGETLFADVSRLPPGSTLSVDAHRRVEIDCFWQLAPNPSLSLRRDAEHAEALRQLLFVVVAEHAGPGPVGVTLSSGLDSTAVAAAARAGDSPPEVVALSWTTPELPEADEARGIEETSRFLGLELLQTRGDRHWPLGSDLELDPPLGGPPLSAYSGLWDQLFAAARGAGLRRVLTGLGGDHLFGGNVFSYPDLLLTGQWLRLARELRAHLPISSFGLPRLLERMLLRPLVEAVRPPSGLPSREQFPWVSEEALALIPEAEPAFHEGFLLPGRRARLEVLADSLIPPVVEQHNRAAARFGLELRHPLLDHRLFELAARLPSSQSFEAGLRKGILRRALAGRLPPSILDQKHKIYPTQIAWRGLRERETARVWDLLSGMKLAAAELVDERALRRVYQDFLDGRGPHRLFWHTLTLEAWMRRHCD